MPPIPGSLPIVAVSPRRATRSERQGVPCFRSRPGPGKSTGRIDLGEQVPSGPRILVDYTDPAAPVLAVRPQERFGLSETPAVGRGHVSLTLYLRPPAGRPSR